MQYRKNNPEAKEYIPRVNKNIVNTPQICQYCGKEFYSKHIQKYCSQECAHGNISKRPSLI